MGKAWSDYMAKNGKQEYEIGDPMTIIDQLRAELAAAHETIAAAQEEVAALCAEHNATVDERDALRAELAAVKEEADSATRNWKLTQERATRWAKESTALAADNARLRKALETIADDGIERSRDPRTVIAQSALAATPAQSLAAHDAALLREVANAFEAQEINTETREPSESYDTGYRDGQYCAVNWLIAKVASIKKEAQRG
jgi:uncharacterized protein (DUF3084 family)